LSLKSVTHQIGVNINISICILQENIQLTKEVQELKISIENITYLRSQVITQLDECKRRLEDEDRRRVTLESHLHSIEMELESCRVQLEEESEARLDLERQLQKANGDCQLFKSKYETEVQARAEEIEDIRYSLLFAFLLPSLSVMQNSQRTSSFKIEEESKNLILQIHTTQNHR
jgi:chromosome segregation ATPase